MKRTNKKGFTLVELVIVIAIIAILAAVLIPTFAGVVNKANESAALQSARNAYTAIMAETDAEFKTVKGVSGKKVLNVAAPAATDAPTKEETIIDLADYFNGDITATFANNTITIKKGTVNVYITETGASLTNPNS